MALVTAPEVVVCHSGESRSARGLQRAERDWVDALERRDVRRLGCRLAAGFVEFNWQGRKLGRDAILAALPKRPPSMLRLTDVTIRLYGGVGLVRGLNTQVDPSGKAVGSVRFTDAFVFKDGRWQAVAAQETLVPAAGPAR